MGEDGAASMMDNKKQYQTVTEAREKARSLSVADKKKKEPLFSTGLRSTKMVISAAEENVFKENLEEDQSPAQASPELDSEKLKMKEKLTKLKLQKVQK